MDRRLIELSTYDWVRLRDFELTAHGADPVDRIRFTGHTRCMPEHYLTSIGTWGGAEVFELVDDAEPHTSVVPVSMAAYRRYKARHRLLSGSQFARLHGPHEWVRAELCYMAHERAQDAFSGTSGTRGPIGVACDYASSLLGSRPGLCILGVLPVEVVLWTRVFDALLSYHGITASDWGALDLNDKASVWAVGGDDGPWRVEPFLHGVAVRGLPERPLAAAS